MLTKNLTMVIEYTMMSLSYLLFIPFLDGYLDSHISDFPCGLLHPLAHGADRFPHNLKVFNLCMIKKMGLENWAKNKSKQSFDRYYNDKLDTCA